MKTEWTRAAWAIPPTPAAVLSHYLLARSASPIALAVLLQDDDLRRVRNYVPLLCEELGREYGLSRTQVRSTALYDELFADWSVDRSPLRTETHGWYLALLFQLNAVRREYVRQKREGVFGQGELRRPRRMHCSRKLRAWQRMHLPLCSYYAAAARTSPAGLEDATAEADPAFWEALARCGYTDPRHWAHSDHRAFAAETYHPLDDGLYAWWETRIRHAPTCVELYLHADPVSSRARAAVMEFSDLCTAFGAYGAIPTEAARLWVADPSALATLPDWVRVAKPDRGVWWALAFALRETARELPGGVECVIRFLPLLSWYESAVAETGEIPPDASVPLSALYPWPERAEGPDSLPCVQPLLQHVQFWHAIRPPHPSAVVWMLNKVVPFRAISRALNRNLVSCCRREPAFRDFVFRLARCFFMGLYPASTAWYKSDDFVRVAYGAHAVYFDPRLGSVGCERLLADLGACPRVCTYMVQRYLVHLLSESVPHLRAAQRDPRLTSIDWDSFERLVHDACNELIAPALPASSDPSCWSEALLTANGRLDSEQSSMGRRLWPLLRQAPIQRLRHRVEDIAVNLTVAVARLEDRRLELTAALRAAYELGEALPATEPLAILRLRFPRSTGEEPHRLLERVSRRLLPPTDRTCPRGELPTRLLAQLHDCRTRLRAIGADLDADERTVLWKRALGCLPESGGPWGALSPAGQERIQRLLSPSFRHASMRRVDNTLAELSLRDFRTLQWLLRMREAVDSVQLVRLDADTAVAVERGLRERHYSLPTDAELPDAAYRVCVTFCCERVATFKQPGRVYGTAKIVYDAERNLYACNKKRATIGDKRERGQIPRRRRGTVTDSTPRLADTDAVTRRRAGRRRKNETDRLDCLHRPPVLTVNLRGFRLIHGARDAHLTSYQHCPRCGNLHRYSPRGWGSFGYACGRCRAQEHLRTDACAHDRHLTILPDCDAKKSRSKTNSIRLLTASASDGTRPFATLVYCAEHAPGTGRPEKRPRECPVPFAEDLLMAQCMRRPETRAGIQPLTTGQRRALTNWNSRRARALKNMEDARRSGYG